ncbi:MAG: 2,3-bisphosphoglycerate-independent phosphoglycerate mutase [Promethearchaeota archaeon]
MDSLKFLLVILDGVGDRPIPDYGGKTPLEAAFTPHLDALARDGSCGLVDVVEPGMPVGSDIAHLLLFGYDYNRDYPGRGPLEALGIGLAMGQDDIAFRGNFANIDQNMIIIDRRAGRNIPEAKEYIKVINDAIKSLDLGVDVTFKHSTEQRVACLIHGPSLSPRVSSTNPNKNFVPVEECRPLDGSGEARATASIINAITRKIYEVLKDHPLNKSRKERGVPQVNCILFHGPGVMKKIVSLHLKHGIKVAGVTGNGVIRGLCRYLGIDVIPCPGATGTINTNLDAKMDAVEEGLKDHDLVFLHIKATDSSGHDKKPEQKKLFLEDIDRIVGGRILRDIDHSCTTVVITGDHSTPCVVGDHSGDPVPFLMHGPAVIADDVEQFGERACASGYFARFSSRPLMNIILNKLDKLKKFGA